MLLCDAFGDPDDVAAFLLLQFQVRVEDTEVELLHESVDVQFDLQREILEPPVRCDNFEIQTSCSKNLSSRVLSPGLFPEPSKSAAYSA